MTISKNNPIINWLIRYKIYHLPFWFIYHITWWTLTIGSIAVVFNNIFFSVYSIKFLFYFVFQALGAYFNLYYLMPVYLEKGRYATYLILVLFTILATAALTVPGYYLSAWISASTFEELYHRDPANFMYFFKVNTLPGSTASMTLAMSVKLAKNWIESRKKQHELEKEKLETELKFLKSQFNPHFLFNSINSIFVLIHKNPDMASESLAKFSDLLRYQLYECNEAQIPLSQELNYVENFIELEKLRHDKNFQLNIGIERNTQPELHIAPFILMPFIENAFKHVSGNKDRINRIDMEIKIGNHDLSFFISNSISAQNGQDKSLLSYRGIGLKNIQRRLSLLYDGKHELEIHEDGRTYKVRLHLVLSPVYIIKESGSKVSYA